MIITCKKCGKTSTGHQVGRMDIPYVIIQCSKCCFIDRIVLLTEILKTRPYAEIAEKCGLRKQEKGEGLK